MQMYEVIEKSTGARMSRSPTVGEFVGMSHKGEPRYSTPGECMGTTLFDDAGKALDWLREQGLSGTHIVSRAT
jgi:hypothetical protein